MCMEFSVDNCICFVKYFCPIFLGCLVVKCFLGHQYSWIAVVFVETVGTVKAWTRLGVRLDAYIDNGTHLSMIKLGWVLVYSTLRSQHGEGSIPNRPPHETVTCLTVMLQLVILTVLSLSQVWGEFCHSHCIGSLWGETAAWKTPHSEYCFDRGNEGHSCPFYQ